MFDPSLKSGNTMAFTKKKSNDEGINNEERRN